MEIIHDPRAKRKNPVAPLHFKRHSVRRFGVKKRGKNEPGRGGGQFFENVAFKTVGFLAGIKEQIGRLTVSEETRDHHRPDLLVTAEIRDGNMTSAQRAKD